jgi:hypothetical protein
MKRDLLKVNTPTREKEICRALQTIFHDIDNGLTDKECFNILGWNYSTKEELFGEYDKDKITVNTYLDYPSMIFNDDDKEIDPVEGAIVYNLDITE